MAVSSVLLSVGLCLSMSHLLLVLISFLTDERFIYMYVFIVIYMFMYIYLNYFNSCHFIEVAELDDGI